MKKILFINGHLNSGGCERSLTDVLKHLNYQKYDVDLLLVEGLGDYYIELPKQVNVLYYPLVRAYGPLVKTLLTAIKRKDWFSLRYRLVTLVSTILGKRCLKLSKSLFRDVKKHYDVIVAYRPGVCSDLAAFAFSADKRITWWHHGELNLSNDQVLDLDLTYKIFDTVVAVSKSSERIVLESFSNSRGKTVVIPNMVCVEEIEKKAEDSSRINKKPNMLTLVSVGRMSPEKHMTLCPMVGKALKEKGICFKWYIIGDGDDMQTISDEIEKTQMSDYFVLTGRLSNPYHYIMEADILVHPSPTESQGLTVLEAMALKTPVVVVESEGTKEFLLNRINGLIVQDTVNSICAGVIDMLDMDQKNIVCKAYDTASLYSPSKIINQVEKELDN